MAELTRIEICERKIIEFQPADGYPDSTHLRQIVHPSVPVRRYWNEDYTSLFKQSISFYEMGFTKIEMRFTKWVSLKKDETHDTGYYVITKSFAWVPDENYPYFSG